MADYKKYILSKGTHYISNSGSDESGNLHGGKAGDQTGKEWQLRSWYKRPWTCVLRWPDINAGTLIAQLGIDAALNNKIGYDQWQRDTFWKEVQKVGYLPAKITTACEEDCTAGVNGIVHCAGYLLGIQPLQDIPEKGIRSSNMRKTFKAAGFQVLTADKYVNGTGYLLPGDILLYDNHHAATNITKGAYVAYTYHDVIDNLDEYTGGYKLGDRVLEKGCKGEDVKELQEDLTQLGWSFPKYGADGDFGDETEANVKGFQRAYHLPADGVMNDEDYAALFNALARYVEVTGNSVNVRAAPSLTAKDIGTAHKGDRLPYGGQTMKDDRGVEWYLVDWKNENGWVSGKLARLVG